MLSANMNTLKPHLFSFTKKGLKNLFVVTFLIFGVASISNAQRAKSSITGNRFKIRKKANSRKPLNYINSLKAVGTLSSATYLGDLCEGSDCIKLRPSISAGIQYRLNESISFRGELAYVRLSGTDQGGDNETRNLSFFSNTLDFSAMAIYDIFSYNKMYRRRQLISPYIALGLGFHTVNPMVKYQGVNYNLRKLQTEGLSYSAVSMTIPYGLGARMKVHPLVDVALEASWRLSFSDHLDDVSGSYYEPIQRLPEDDIRRVLADRRPVDQLTTRQLSSTQRGNPTSNDGYFMFSAKVDYTLKVTKQRYSINSNTSRFRLIKSIKKK